MSLLEKIQDDLKAALKEKQKKKTGALRMLIAALKNEEINKRPKELEESDVLGVVKREVKKLNDAILQFKEGGREDLAEEYKKEAEILKKYMPEALPEAEIRKIVQNNVSATEDPSSPEATEGRSKNFGAIMKAVMAETKGQADGSTVSKIVREEMEK